MSNCILANHPVGKQASEGPKDSTRVELAACAARFFSERGYHGTSTQAIAQQCNIRKASLFHHYKTKEDIALAAIQYVQRECGTRIFKEAENTDQDPKQRISNFVKAAECFFTEHLYALLPIILALELSEEKMFEEPIAAYFRAWTDAVTRLLVPVCNSTAAAEKLAEESVKRIQGALVTARIQKSKQPIADLASDLQRMWSV